MSKLFVSAGRILLLLIMLVLAGSSALARESILYQFPGGSGGDDPVSGIVFDNQGNAYGTTYYGGTYGWGAIFRLEPSHGGWTQQILYSFLGTNDGFNPVGNLLIDATGNLYGTTESGGNGAQCTPGYYCGTVFELARSNGGWKHLVLYNFCSLSGAAMAALQTGWFLTRQATCMAQPQGEANATMGAAPSTGYPPRTELGQKGFFIHLTTTVTAIVPAPGSR